MTNYFIENAANEGKTVEEMKDQAYSENLIVVETDHGWIGFDSQYEFDLWNSQV